MNPNLPSLPGKNCGLCGFKTCDDLAAKLETQPELVKRCILLSANTQSAHFEASVHAQTAAIAEARQKAPQSASSCASCGNSCAPSCAGSCADSHEHTPVSGPLTYKDSLGRPFDFYLDHFPEDPGPREIILPHNPMVTRELDVQLGDVLIGRPLGMSCGCPVTHCGVVVQVDHRSGVMTWCVTGPLGPRQGGFKDLGYYSAEGYEGMVRDCNAELKIGMRYFFQPRRCMLQWRHSGMLNYLNRTKDGWQVRLEGLWIG